MNSLTTGAYHLMAHAVASVVVLSEKKDVFGSGTPSLSGREVASRVSDLSSCEGTDVSGLHLGHAVRRLKKTTQVLYDWRFLRTQGIQVAYDGFSGLSPILRTTVSYMARRTPRELKKTVGYDVARGVKYEQNCVLAAAGFEPDNSPETPEVEPNCRRDTSFADRGVTGRSETRDDVTLQVRDTRVREEEMLATLYATQQRVTHLSQHSSQAGIKLPPQLQVLEVERPAGHLFTPSAELQAAVDVAKSTSYYHMWSQEEKDRALVSQTSTLLNTTYN